MRVLPRFGLSLALLCAVGIGCDQDSGGGPSPSSGSGAPSAGATAANSAGTDLGVRNFGDYFISATRLGPVRPGEETTFDMKIQNGKPTELRCWIGFELGKGATKVPATEQTSGTWQVTLKAPDPLLPDSEFWVERGTKDDPKGSVSFRLRTE